MTVWGMEYGDMAIWGYGNMGMYIFINTVHVWKYKAQCEHNY